jgi:hypothetical protein
MVVEIPVLFLIAIAVAVFLIMGAIRSQYRRDAWRRGQRTCRSCGTNQPATARFCRRCGKQL